MNAQRYPEEFWIEAVKQILEHGHSVADVSRRLGVSTHSLYKWMTRMCRVLRLHLSGYYAWKALPQSQRAIDDQRLLGLLKQAWLESGCVYGYRKLTLDMRDMGEQCSRHRVARLLRCEGLKAQRGYGERPCVRGGTPAVVAPNQLFLGIIFNFK